MLVFNGPMARVATWRYDGLAAVKSSRHGGQGDAKNNNSGAAVRVRRGAGRKGDTVAKMMLDVQDDGAVLWENHLADQRRPSSMIVLRTVVSQETLEELIKYTVRTTDQQNVEVIDERVVGRGTPVSVVLVRTPPETRGRKRAKPVPGEPSEETADCISYVGRSENLFEASLFLDNAEFDRIEQRVATFGMPARVLFRLTMPLEPVPRDEPQEQEDEYYPKDDLQEAKVWHTETLNEVCVTRWRFLWPLSPPQFKGGKPDRRPATREQLSDALKEITRTRRWMIAIFWLVLILAIGRALIR